MPCRESVVNPVLKFREISELDVRNATSVP